MDISLDGVVFFPSFFYLFGLDFFVSFSQILFVVMISYDLCFSFRSARANAFMSLILLRISFHTVHIFEKPSTQPIAICAHKSDRLFFLCIASLESVERCISASQNSCALNYYDHRFTILLLSVKS